MDEEKKEKNTEGAWRVLLWALGILIAINVGLIGYTLKYLQGLEIRSVENSKDIQSNARGVNELRDFVIDIGREQVKRTGSVYLIDELKRRVDKIEGTVQNGKQYHSK